MSLCGRPGDGRHKVAGIFDHIRRLSARSNRRRAVGRHRAPGRQRAVGRGGPGALIAAGVLVGAALGFTGCGNSSPSGDSPAGVSPARSTTTGPTTTGPTATEPTTTGSTTTGSTTTGDSAGAALPGVYREDESGVVRIDAGMCAGSNAGTGFLIAPDLVVTAAHVVDKAAAVALSDGHQTVLGQVIGIDTGTDVALVRASRAFPGHVFKLAATQPGPGTPVGFIGYPQDGPLGLSQGAVTAVDGSLEVQGQPRTGLLQTDALIHPGYSGAPLLSPRGTVVGLADATNVSNPKISYAVAGAAARPLISAWRAGTAAPQEPGCSPPSGQQTGAAISTTQPKTAIIASLAIYFDAIDTGDYAGAYARLAPARRSVLSEAAFAARNRSTYDYGAAVPTVTPSTQGSELAAVDFASVQVTPAGAGAGRCQDWTLEYTMVDSRGSWLIGPARAQAGVAQQPC